MSYSFQPLMEGGFGPFLDLTVNSNASVAFYFLPLCFVAGIYTNLHVSFYSLYIVRVYFYTLCEIKTIWVRKLIRPWKCS